MTFGYGDVIIKRIARDRDRDSFVSCLDKFLFQVLKDDAKSRREVELHWRAATCANIVNIRWGWWWWLERQWSRWWWWWWWSRWWCLGLMLSTSERCLRTPTRDSQVCSSSWNGENNHHHHYHHHRGNVWMELWNCECHCTNQLWPKHLQK